MQLPHGVRAHETWKWHWPWLSLEAGGWSECGRVVCTCFRASVMRSRFILCQQIAQTYLAHLTGALLVWATAVLCGVSGRPESHRSSCVSWCLVLLQNFMPCPFSYSESIPNPIPNPIQKPIPKLQKREKTQDILRFIDFGKKKNFNVASMNRKMSRVFSRFEVSE